MSKPAPGHGDDLQSAIFCLRCWDSNVRIIGNVRVSMLLGLLEKIPALEALVAENTEEIECLKFQIRFADRNF